MPDSFSLELGAIEALAEELKLPRSWQPFDLPHVGTTFTERADYRARLWTDLRERGLAAGDRLDADVENALTAWTRPETLIVVRARQTQHEPEDVLYRAVMADGLGVLSALDGDTILFDLLKSDRLVGAIVSCLPALAAVPLRELSVLDTPATAPVVAPVRSRDVALTDFFAWPLLRFGTFELSVRGRDGRLTWLETAQFFDTDGGRFLQFSTALPDGGKRRTFIPSDGSHLRRWLHDQIAYARDLRNR
ncbi:EspG family protein [Amycolatopsis xylanica]|uniref:EspG family protein n=1 Tax=Amycolatopsis xylanica TaxID=589385 RepID=A0A1H3HKN2_9PSEU|nr:ESX secretion-associated protein EspG [Amycolatopsis xylanica]SDY15930.1 EspG family protein [Amycolatopsis xylanica]